MNPHAPQAAATPVIGPTHVQLSEGPEAVRQTLQAALR
jgi:hypothetical protein